MESYIRRSTIDDIGKGAAYILGATGLGLAGYAAYSWAMEAPAVGLWTAINNAQNEAGIESKWELLFGKETYTDKSDGQTVENMFYGWPILGSLYGSAINLGFVSKPSEWF